MVDAIAELATAMNQYGPVLTMVASLIVLNGVFMWRDWRREATQQQQIAELHRSHNDIVLPLLTDCKEVIAQNSLIITGWLQHGGR